MRSRCSSKCSPCFWLVLVGLHALCGVKNEAKQPAKVEPAARSARIAAMRWKKRVMTNVALRQAAPKKEEREKRSTKQTSTGRGEAEIAVVREESGETC